MMISPEELRHLDSGPSHGERPGGAGTVEIVAICAGNAEQVLSRCREVLRIVIVHQDRQWPALEEWKRLLPEWFVHASAKSQSEEERERWLQWWRGLPPNERAQASDRQPWSLSDWLFWFQHDDRSWFWWDSIVEDQKTARVSVEVSGWPVALGSLEWLLRAAGAIQVWRQEDTVV